MKQQFFINTQKDCLGIHVSIVTESSSGPLRYRFKISCVHNALRDPNGDPAMRYGHLEGLRMTQ